MVDSLKETSLRDSFAMAAMQAFVSGHTAHYGHESYFWPRREIATEAYEMADAMLLSRGGNGWRPIADCPKDGTRFRGWVRASRNSSLDGQSSSFDHDVSQEDYCWYSPPKYDTEGNCVQEGFVDNQLGQIGDAQEVTHFQLCSEPPAQVGNN